MPADHRLDLSLDREWRTKRKGIKSWFGISIYNAYNRVNPFFAYPENGKLEVYGFFPIIPSFHYGLFLGDKKEKYNEYIFAKTNIVIAFSFVTYTQGSMVVVVGDAVCVVLFSSVCIDI